ncbi:MAG: choice-of-anchor tandem repeat GloVer-containing protein [Candidatus Sulfotelmatobacter sp.]
MSRNSSVKVANASTPAMRQSPRWLRICLMVLSYAVTGTALQAQTYTLLHSFDGTDGTAPQAGLVQAVDGNFYGTTNGGGTNSGGTTFKITRGGTLTSLYSFCALKNCEDGAGPTGKLLQATDGDLYGTTYGGGHSYGSIFKMTPGGTPTTLYYFCSLGPNCADGSAPQGSLIQASNGGIYGTSYWLGPNGWGTVFKISPSGTLTTLHGFDYTDGGNPIGLFQASNGNLYGTTEQGGDVLCTGGDACGTVYEITLSGTLTSLVSFCGSQPPCGNGAFPYAGLVQDGGALYGTTLSGGTSSVGNLFKITPNGTFSTLYSFFLGYLPEAALIVGPDGNLYGTTYSGGTSGDGTVFKITPAGVLTTLHNFDGTDGSNPYAPLVEGTDGLLYGTTTAGGANGDGTVFSLDVGFGPFVETLPATGTVGATVRILGTNLTGATSVSFNGTPATFTVSSPSLITTTVPAGATSGTVRVTIPSGTLNSNVVFKVRP